MGTFFSIEFRADSGSFHVEQNANCLWTMLLRDLVTAQPGAQLLVPTTLRKRSAPLVY
jgi:hypothetical protein